jgi:sec-independent protein translocase protein TatC
MNDIKYSLVEHLDELRGRILKALLMFLVCTVIIYRAGDAIFYFLTRPVGTLVFIDPPEAFLTYIRVALWGGFFAAVPFILYQIWAFIVSGLHRHERRYLLVFLPFSVLLFFGGAAFGLIVIIPIGLKLLLSFGTEFMRPMITVSRYVSFVGTLTLAFGIVFQLPIILLFLTRIGIVTPYILQQKRVYAITLIFIVAATLTPPDVISQIAMAIPLMVLYEIGIIFARIGYRSNYNSDDTITEGDSL